MVDPSAGSRAAAHRPRRGRLRAQVPRLAASALLGVAVVAVLHGVDRELPASPTLRCDDAWLLDGTLRCGDEGRAPLAHACPGLHASPGDAIDGAVCSRDRMAPDDLAALGVPIDVNAASVAELASLPGVGPVLAQRIADGRPYVRLHDLLRVRGIGEVTLAAMAPRVRFDTATFRAGARGR